MTTYSFADIFEAVADAVPDRLALVAGPVRLTYRELDHRATRLANFLRDHGIAANDHVGIQAQNRAEWVEAMLALFKLRAVPININFRYSREELRYTIGNADLKGLFFENRFGPELESIQDQLPAPGLYITIDDESTAQGPTRLGAIPYQGAVGAGSGVRDFGPRSDDDLSIVYTGGTTGRSKGVMWRHKELYRAAMRISSTDAVVLKSGHSLASYAPEDVAELVRALPPSRTISALPLMHGAALWRCLASLLSGGVYVLYSGRRFDAREFLQLAAAEQAQLTVIAGDAMALPLIEELQRNSYELALRTIATGGAVTSVENKNKLRRLLPQAVVVEAFGGSEMGHVGTVMDFDQPVASSRFSLVPTAAVLNDDLAPVRPGEAGCIHVSGNIAFGYYKDEERTAASFRQDADGRRWFRTGDFARLGDDGTVTLLGRGSGCINSGAEKIYPEEVELAIKSHPSVYNAIVIGTPDQRMGSKVTALVQLADGASLTLEQLQDHCSGRIARYKLPRELIIVPELGLTAVGKPNYQWAHDYYRDHGT